MFTAVIPVKASSSRLPGKNTLPFGDSNLLIHKIRQLKQVDEIAEILVSSDSQAMLEMAAKEGARAELRPKDLADESRPFADLIRHVAEMINTPHIIWAHATSPTVNSFLYKETINKYKEAITNQYDSLTTVLPFQHFLLDENGPFNFNPDLGITNSQDVSLFDLYTVGCSIISRKLALEKGFLFGALPYRFVVTPYQAIDIDTAFDYEVARAMWDIYGDKE
jgi:CMP-N-acetylneuraminic acid synthetase